MSEENGEVSASDDDMKQAREMVLQLDPFVSSSGWDFYSSMLQRQINVRQGVTPTASDGFGAVFANEFRNGEIAGLMLAMRLAPGSLAAAKELLEELKKEEETDVE
jgi:hypothetical protein